MVCPGDNRQIQPGDRVAQESECIYQIERAGTAGQQTQFPRKHPRADVRCLSLKDRSQKTLGQLLMAGGDAQPR